jgi:Cu/Ag efflux protein CusF
VLHGEVAAVYKDDGAAALYHQEVPGFLMATERPASMEFQVPDPRDLALLKPGTKIVARVRRRGGDYILEQIRPEGISRK